MLVDAVVAHGVPRAVFGELLATVPAEGRVPVERFYDLMERAAQHTDDPDELALLIGRDTRPESFDILGYMVSTAETLGAALRAVVNFGRLVTDEPVSLVPLGDQTRLVYQPVGPRRPAHRYVSVMMLVDVAHALADLSGAPVQARQAVLPGGRPSTRLLQQLGGVEVVDGWPPSLTYDDRTLALPTRTANPPVYAFLEGLAVAELEARDDSLEHRAREHIRRRLPHGTATLDAVARALAMSRRSLQRALRAESLGFSELREDVRRESASLHLAHGRTVTEVALLLGYSDARAFRRAFRRWHGRSPGSAR